MTYGKSISIVEIDSCHWYHSKALEFYYIRKYISDGYVLTNKCIPWKEKVKPVIIRTLPKERTEEDKQRVLKEMEEWFENILFDNE